VSCRARRLRGQGGHALLLVLGILLATLAGAVVLGALAAAVWAQGAHQRAADLAALAAARALRDAYPRVFAPPAIDGRVNGRHLSTAAYLALGRRVALATAGRNGAEDVDVSFPGGGLAPLRVHVSVRDPIGAGPARTLRLDAEAEAELLPPGPLAGGIPRGQRRVPRPTGLSRRQAHAPGRCAGLRPDGRRGPSRWPRSRGDQRLPHRRRAGAPVR
jgi:hypothetical protein